MSMYLQTIHSYIERYLLAKILNWVERKNSNGFILALQCINPSLQSQIHIWELSPSILQVYRDVEKGLYCEISLNHIPQNWAWKFDHYCEACVGVFYCYGLGLLVPLAGRLTLNLQHQHNHLFPHDETLLYWMKWSPRMSMTPRSGH